jgi:predicted ATPase
MLDDLEDLLFTDEEQPPRVEKVAGFFPDLPYPIIPTEGGREVAQLTSLRLAGWKSIRDAEIKLRPLNVLIGANGAGKSNLVSFFKLMNEMMGSRFQVYVAATGGAESLLHCGSKRTAAIQADFQFDTDLGQSTYSLRLVPAAGNTLIFEEEKLTFSPPELPEAESFASVGGEPRYRGHRESELDRLYDRQPAEPDIPSTDFDRSGEAIRSYLHDCRVFHFHDSSLLGPMRRDCPVDANRFLYPDAANLPAMLYLYRERYPTAYRRIVAAVKAVAPFFEDFVLEPLRLNPRNIALHWRAKGSDYDFGPHQLSDGTLRAVALFTLLLQPEDDLPELIVLDEPELGLHPAALAVLADLLRSTARHSQLLIATQSAALIDHFEAEDVVAVNLRDGCSTFERLNPERLKDWLKEYMLSELWERNVIGGGPY